MQSAISCESSMSNIISNGKSHPNELLACNDTSLLNNASLLKTAQEIEEQRIQAAQEMQNNETNPDSNFKNVWKMEAVQ
jgi:hypothetical protein